NGSGRHGHQSLFKNGKNAFFDGSEKNSLSAEARAYSSGLLKHAKEIVCVTNPWVKSYKRLVAGYEAPVYIAWAQRNRSALVRVPLYKPGKEAATRVELRNPDPAANPYLAFSVMLAAGLEGIEKGYDLQNPVEENIFDMGPADFAKHGIDALPGSLYEAAMELKNSELMKRVLGDHLNTNLVENKLIEWDPYR
ncbi:glutamine synthetase, partial [Oceanidesulfovibrio marinus]